jgi:hypothetical protein
VEAARDEGLPGTFDGFAERVRAEAGPGAWIGLAVLDLQPDRIEAAYVDDDGHVARTETIT